MSKLLIAAVVVWTVAITVAVLNAYDLLALPDPVLLASRWLSLAILVIYALRGGTLTTWIFVSIVAGIEVGHDFPEVAASLRILSQIFLRLIRTIIAPLLFATLVVGIAGHSNL